MSKWLLVLFLALPLWGQSELERAQSLYAASDFAGAQQIFREELRRTADSPQLQAPICYGLGNCAFFLGDLAESILWYRCCLSRNPMHTSAAENLARVESRLGVNGNARNESFNMRKLFILIDAKLGIFGFFTLEMLLVVGTILVRKRRFVLAVFLTILVVLTLVFSAYHIDPRVFGEVPQEAVIAKIGAELRQEPHSSYAPLVKLGPGELVVVESHSRRWARIRHGDLVGWVEHGALGFVE